MIIEEEAETEKEEGETAKDAKTHSLAQPLFITLPPFLSFSGAVVSRARAGDGYIPKFLLIPGGCYFKSMCLPEEQENLLLLRQ